MSAEASAAMKKRIQEVEKQLRAAKLIPPNQGGGGKEIGSSKG
jgi:transcription elongation GreA/GreB family factor